MFLVVFVTLAISIIGLFGQVYALQAARMNAAQVSLGQTLLTWHGAASAIARQTPFTNSAGTSGCDLSGGIAETACATATGNVSVQTGNGSTVLPPIYSASYVFDSLVYQPVIGSSALYTLTYASVKADGTIQSATGLSLGYTPAQLMHQLKLLNVRIAYGTVDGTGHITTPATPTSLSKSFVVPAIVPPGSVGIISPAN